ncbi:MAG: alkyl hydroperoxide reductase subunit F [Pseudomonadota bacterium]
MLDDNMKEQLKAWLERITLPVELVASLDDSPASAELRTLLADIAALSPQITWRAGSGAATRRPSFVIRRTGTGVQTEFAGIPTGHEFTSLVLALLQTGGHPPKIEPEVIEQIRALDGEYRFETFVSLSCHNCPDVVQALNAMSVLNPKIRHVMIDGALFGNEVEARGIMGVPAVFLNGRPFGQGRMSLEEILAKLDAGAAARDADRLAHKEVFDVLVVGGGPSGSAAAIYAARKGIRTGVVAERFGGQVQDTLGIENFISVKETEGPKLASALEEHVRQYGVDIMNGRRAVELVPAERSADGLARVRLDNGAVLRAKSVVLSTGARWRDMNVPGEQEYRTKGVAYCPHCDGPLFRGKKVAVVGGGNSGVEAAIDLAGIVEHVTLLEVDDRLRADAVLQQKLYGLPNVTVLLSAQTIEVTGDGGRMNGLWYANRITGAQHRLDLDGVFVQIGLVPNTDWLKGTVELSNRGEIVVGERGDTGVAGIYAAGDCTTVPFKQIIIAMGDGARAALGAFDYLLRRPAAGTQQAA